jgi:hypothetical protein
MAPLGEIPKVIPFGKQFPIKRDFGDGCRPAGCWLRTALPLKLPPNFLRHWHSRGTLAVKSQFPQYEK